MTNDKPMTSVVEQLRRHTSPTALTGTRPSAHEDVMEWTVGELLALLQLEARADNTAIGTLAGLERAVAFARTVLARDARDGFPRKG